jgi:hypothetical protein
MLDLRIQKDNQKVKCPIFSMPSLTTCPEKVECRKYCYDCKSSKRFPSITKSRNVNLESSKDENFVNEMIYKIKGFGSRYFRIHAGGDFYSTEYINSWFKICEALPDIKFLAYTKDAYRDIPFFTDEVLSRKPKNLRLLRSIDGINTQVKLNDLKALKGKFDGIAITHATLTNCGVQLKDNVRCMIECTKCFTSDLIIFKKH